MGLPFDSGHYLALRHFPINSIAPAYHSVWHRDPAGRWVFYVDTSPNRSCARYFDAAIAETRIAGITVDWTAPNRLVVTVEGVLEWTLELRHTAATRLLIGAGHLLPARLWRSPAVLDLPAKVAGRVLRAGRLCLAGRVPNGQVFVANR